MEEMTYCRACGLSVEDGENLCPRCGKIHKEKEIFDTPTNN